MSNNKSLNSRRILEEKIRSLLHKPIKIKFKGSQGTGNSWESALGIEVNNKPGPDWDDIEIKSLTYNQMRPKAGTAMSLSTKVPDWNILKEFGVNTTSFFHKLDYNYKSVKGSIFFTSKLRYVVSEATRSIDWYFVNSDCPPTEPYSVVPARIGKHVFSWKVEDVLRKAGKLSVTFLVKKGNFPDGTITPVRSYLIDTYPDKFLELLRKGSIVYEVRYGAKEAKDKILWEKVKREAEEKFPSNKLEKPTWFASELAKLEKRTWFASEFTKLQGKGKDYGTAFRLERDQVNSMLDFGSEILY